MGTDFVMESECFSRLGLGTLMNKYANWEFD